MGAYGCACERESKYLFEDVFVSACVRVGVSKCVSVYVWCICFSECGFVCALCPLCFHVCV